MSPTTRSSAGTVVSCPLRRTFVAVGSMLLMDAITLLACLWSEGICLNAHTTSWSPHLLHVCHSNDDNHNHHQCASKNNILGGPLQAVRNKRKHCRYQQQDNE